MWKCDIGAVNALTGYRVEKRKEKIDTQMCHLVRMNRARREKYKGSLEGTRRGVERKKRAKRGKIFSLSFFF